MATLMLASGGVALGMAWAIGAQDVSNALGTAVGSKAVTVQQAIMIGAVCEFAGALVGGDVAQTISKGILDPKLTGSLEIYSQIMFCTLAGAFIWLAIATAYALPVSTSHSLIGSLVGLGLVLCPQALNVSALSKVILSWVISPAAGAIISFFVFYIINKFILKNARPLRAAQNLIPYFFGFTLSVLTAFSTLAGPVDFRLSRSFVVFTFFSACFYLSSGF
uniref:Phosphate transporter n=1 Tax=Spongospora subterranea TaxID=70186 RepID=A0A0H5R5C2_9EUKA|eukprot:CRZ03349.1 hypothetical protein [Spongospora subterranea]